MDNLNQSTPNIPLPEELQARIENAKNNLTLIEAEYSRLQKLVIDIDGQIKVKHIEFKELSDKIDEKNSILKSLNEEISDLESKKVSLTNSLVGITEQISTLESLSESYNSNFAKQKTELDNKEKELADRESLLIVKESDLTKRESEHLKKVEKIKLANLRRLSRIILICLKDRFKMEGLLYWAAPN